MWQLPRKSTQSVRSHFSCPFGFSYGWLNSFFHLTLQVRAGFTVLTQSPQKKLQLWETWLSVSRCCSVEAASTCSLHPSAWSENWSQTIRSCACCNVWPVTINYLFTSHARVSTWPSTEKFIPFNRENLNYLTRKKKSHWKSWTLKTSKKGFSWLKQWVVTAFSEFIVPVSGFLWRISLRSYSK